MKKLLSILGAAGLVVSTSAVLVSCGTKEEDKKPETKKIDIVVDDFTNPVDKTTIVLGEVKLGEKVIENITLNKEFNLSDDGKSITEATISSTEPLAAGEYTGTLKAKTIEAPVTLAAGDEASTTFTFTVEAEETKDPELKTIIGVTDLETLEDSEVHTILAGIMAKNKTVTDENKGKLTIADATVVKRAAADTTTNYQAEVTAKDGFTGTVIVTFSVTIPNEEE